jgi:hypothetical protein
MTSMRSRSGAGMASSTFAVPMNSTFDRSKGTPRVIVAERVVLLRIEHLEQRRERIALMARRQLVHLVEHEHGIAAAGLAHGLHDVAGQRADVGAPMAADLRLVVHAAQTHAPELQAERFGDALPERGLADAGRTDEAQDGAAPSGIQLAHREEFEDAPLHLLEPVMILIEDGAGAVDVELFGSSFDHGIAISQSR